MNIYIPDYYKNFSCIKNRCRHNCCIGWEIDIDDVTLNRYKGVDGDFKKKLSLNISEEDTPHFILDKNERCPFLNSDNLCDIYINLGEDYLCQICSDHPRFRNFFDSRTEMGLGLACEEAARIILENKNTVKIIPLSSKTENNTHDDDIFFNFRERVFKIVQDRSIPINERILKLAETFSLTLPSKTHTEWADILLSFEQMGTDWTKSLKKLRGLSDTKHIIISDKRFETASEQLLVYFIFRHLSDACFDFRFRERLAFCILSVMIIDFLAYSKSVTDGLIDICDLIEISRLYSAELEYSEENIEKILNILSE